MREKTGWLICLALLAGSLASCAAGYPQQPVWDRVHNTTLSLTIGFGSCSGTAVGKQTILSASHCFPDGTKLVIASGEACEIAALIHDGQDHVLVRVTGCTFDHVAKIGKPAKVGDEVFIWGNPWSFQDLLRVGRVSGYQDTEWKGMGKLHVQLSDLHITNGDSGSALFNTRGEITSVLSIGTLPFAMAGTFPMKFSREQLGMIK